MSRKVNGPSNFVPSIKDRLPTPVFLGFSGGSEGKEPTCSVGDLGLISGLGISPGRRHSNPLQCSCLENPVDREACACSLGYSAWGHKESDRTDVTKQAHS